MTALAQRAVASPHWRWMPGMLGLSAKAGRWRVERADLTALSGAGAGPASIHEVGVWLPDLDDPATLGCLLALVREAWGVGENKYAYIAVLPPVTSHMNEPWSVVVCDHVGEWPFRCDGDTEAEALVAALEAAP